MNLEEIQAHMRSLRLHGMSEALEVMLFAGQSRALNAEQMLAALIQAELDDREDRKTERLKKTAKFRYTAVMEQIKPSAERGLEASVLAKLSTPRWIRQAENVVITGATGVGKSYLASALGHHACHLGFRTLYFNAQKLFEELKLARLDGTHRKLMAAWPSPMCSSSTTSVSNASKKPSALTSWKLSRIVTDSNEPSSLDNFPWRTGMK